MAQGCKITSKKEKKAKKHLKKKKEARSHSPSAKWPCREDDGNRSQKPRAVPENSRFVITTAATAVFCDVLVEMFPRQQSPLDSVAERCGGGGDAVVMVTEVADAGDDTVVLKGKGRGQLEDVL